jgi:hypothetical protein
MPIHEPIVQRPFALMEVYARKDLERLMLMTREQGHQQQTPVSKYAGVRDPIANPSTVRCNLRPRVVITGPENLRPNEVWLSCSPHECVKAL